MFLGLPARAIAKAAKRLSRRRQATCLRNLARYFAAAASLVGVLAIFNGGGRILWAWISGHTGKMGAFALMLGLQGICLLLIPHAHNAVLFFILGAIVYLCCGGGFGTMPATAGDFFGVTHAGAIYGLMVVGWSAGGVIGSQVIAALIGKGHSYCTALQIIELIARFGLEDVKKAKPCALPKRSN